MSSFKDAVKSGMTEYLEELKEKLEGLSEAELHWQATLDTNTLIWLVWHMARVEDNWINKTIAGGETIWSSGDWARKTGIGADGSGSSQKMDEVRAFPQVNMRILISYYDEVRCSAFDVIDAMSESDGNNEIDRGRGPITWNWILGHVVVEESQHLGQVALIRGMIRGLDG